MSENTPTPVVLPPPYTTPPSGHQVVSSRPRPNLPPLVIPHQEYTNNEVILPGSRAPPILTKEEEQELRRKWFNPEYYNKQ